jgi:hypothetical protein
MRGGRRTSIIIVSAGSVRKIFENDPLCDSSIAARPKEEFIIVDVRIIFGFATVPLNYFT